MADARTVVVVAVRPIRAGGVAVRDAEKRASSRDISPVEVRAAEVGQPEPQRRR